MMIQMKEVEFENLVRWITNIDNRIGFIMQHNTSAGGDLDFFQREFANVSFSSIVCSLMKLLDSQVL